METKKNVKNTRHCSRLPKKSEKLYYAKCSGYCEHDIKKVWDTIK